MIGTIIFIVLYVLGGVFTFKVCAEEFCTNEDYITVGETFYLLCWSLASFLPGMFILLFKHENDPLIKRRKKS